MGNKKHRPGGEGPMSAEERMKYVVAEEIGLLGKVIECGWAGLTAAETGRVGGLVRTRLMKGAV